MKKIIEKCKRCKEENININEMQTKTSLIVPFFKCLNYDVEDYGIFRAELSCGRERVDYAIMKNGQPNILIETKKISECLENHLPQIIKYMKFHRTATVGILTNGEEYRFYIRNESKLKEVWRLNICSLTEADNTLIELCVNKGVDVITNEILMKPYIIDVAIKQIIYKPSKEIIDIFKLNTGMDSLSNNDLKNSFERVFSKGELKSEEEYHDYKKDKYYKTLIGQKFSDEEAKFLLTYNKEHSFDFARSLKIWVQKYYYSKKLYDKKTDNEVFLSEMVNDYAEKMLKLDYKRKEYIMSNKILFSNIVKKTALAFDRFNLIDDISNIVYKKSS